MKQKLLTTLIILMMGFLTPVFSSDYVSIDEYEKMFEMGFMGDEPDEDDAPIEFKPKQKEHAISQGDEIIEMDSIPFKLQAEEFNFLNSFKQVYLTPQTRVDLYKTKRFALFSDGKHELSDYMTNNFKSTLNVSYDCNDILSFRAGHEVWYVNTNANVGAKKFYFNPRINLSDSVYLDYISKYNQTSKNFEQELGLNYSPKFLHNTASFGIKASTVIDDNYILQSKKIKFSTDLYIY